VRSVLLALLIVAAVAASGSNRTPAEVDDVGNIMVAFGVHLEAHPMAQAEDLYKFLHQAVYGPGHAIPNRQAAAAYLERELEGLGPPMEAEPLCEDLGGQPVLVRVNLRPLMADGGNPDLLLDAFVESANQVHGSSERMETVLSLAVSWLTCASRPDLSRELDALVNELAEKGYPAIHHSESYRDVYRPAYRVVAAETAEAHGWCEGR
jgi:hypothetical protein